METSVSLVRFQNVESVECRVYSSESWWFYWVEMPVEKYSEKIDSKFGLILLYAQTWEF